MNAKKHKYTIKFEPGRGFSIYDDNVLAHSGYDTYAEAERDLERIQDEDEPASLEDFETFFKNFEDQERRIA